MSSATVLLRRAPTLWSLTALLTLAACDAQQAAAPAPLPQIDPAIADALADPILIDPDLGQQANDDALRPPDRPATGGVPPVDIVPIDPIAAPAHKAPAPTGECRQCALAARSLTLGALAAAQPSANVRSCAAQLRYSARWAARLPAVAPLPRDARVLVAAGTDAGSCRLRAVRFVTASPVGTMIDFYHAAAATVDIAAKHRATGEVHALDADGYAVIARPRADGPGSSVELVVDRPD